MAAREEIVKRIEKKQAEIEKIERDAQIGIEKGKAYIDALREALRMFPKERGESTSVRALRPGSNLAKAREAIKKAGRPLHITDILKQLGLPVDRAHRSNLSGTLGAYVRRGEIFTKTAPNTFGLVELEAEEETGGGESDSEEPERPVELNGSAKQL